MTPGRWLEPWRPCWATLAEREPWAGQDAPGWSVALTGIRSSASGRTCFPKSWREEPLESSGILGHRRDPLDCAGHGSPRLASGDLYPFRVAGPRRPCPAGPPGPTDSGPVGQRIPAPRSLRGFLRFVEEKGRDPLDAALCRKPPRLLRCRFSGFCQTEPAEVIPSDSSNPQLSLVCPPAMDRFLRAQDR